MKILFVCKYNIFRSQAAEAYFNQIAKEKGLKHKAYSAGVFANSTFHKEVKDAIVKSGLKPKGYSEGLNRLEVKKMDFIIIVAEDVPKHLFADLEKHYDIKVLWWKIKDSPLGDPKGRLKTIARIKKRIDKFVEPL